jgi:hypothetical protein
MRELTKSMVGFSWAVGLFGFQQFTRMMSAGTEPPEKTAAELNDVAQAAERHLSEPFARQFHAGDEWQRRLVDVFFDTASLRSFDARAIASTFDPRPMIDGIDPRSVIQSGVDLVGRSVDLLRPIAAPRQNGAAPRG